MTAEDRLLREILERLPATPPGAEDAPRIVVGPGDDAAVVRAGGDARAPLLLTVDAAEEGVHFDRKLHPPAAIGRRTVAAAVSDIAAMGGAPVAALASLVVPRDARQTAREVMRAAGERAAELGAPVVGGNLSSGARLALHVTVVGTAPAGAPPVRRRGARPGDALFVSGPLGGAALGLEALRRRAAGEAPGRRLSGREAAWVDAHLDPQPRLALGAELAGLATAGMDLSDGLALDLHRLLEAASCGGVVEAARIPAAGPGPDGLEAALFGGEDYELLFAGPAGAVEARAVSGGRPWAGVTRIGEVTSGSGVRLRSPDGGLAPLARRGWDALEAGGDA